MDCIVERILFLVKNSGFTAKIIMEEAEISRSSITEWKKGKAKPSTDAIIKLSKYFNVSTDYLLLGEEKKVEASKDESEFLEIYKQIPLDERKEFIAYIKGYIARGKIEYKKAEACRKKEA